METPLDVLKRALATQRVDDDGEPIQLDLLPPLSDIELNDFRARLPCDLPQHIAELLKYCRGFDGSAADEVDFLGELPFGHTEIFPHGLPIASDGFGNFWVIDLNPDSSDFGPVYFACHDPPVIALQSTSLSGFLKDLLRLDDQEGSVIDFVHDEATASIWRDDPAAVPHSDALTSDDPILRDLARRVTDQFFIVDLRDADVGEGFSWGRFGPDTRILRQGAQPIFACGPAK